MVWKSYLITPYPIDEVEKKRETSKGVFGFFGLICNSASNISC